MVSNWQKTKQAFTIVELLVVIVVIGILAAITIISYSGVNRRAIIANLQSDLVSDAKLLKMYNVEYGYYPSAIDPDTHCPTAPTTDMRYCLKASPNVTITYTGGNQSFKIIASRNGIVYLINEGSAPYPSSKPTLASNTAIAVKAGIVNFGATITDDGGDAISDAGFCWGTSPNPTNCYSNKTDNGKLIPIGSVSVGNPTKDLIASSDNKNVYIITLTWNTVTVYTRNTDTGILTGTSSALTDTTPYGVAISPDDKYVYDVSVGTNTVSMYSRNMTNGSLTGLGTLSTSLSTPSSIAISPDGKAAYIANYSSGTVSIFNRNISTGILTYYGVTASVGTTPYGRLAISPDGKNVYVGTSNSFVTFSRNQTDNSLTLIDSKAMAMSGGVAVSPDGKTVYSISGSTLYAFTRDTSTGMLTQIGSKTTCGSVMGPVVSADNTSIYSPGGTACKHNIDQITKIPSAVETFTSGGSSNSITVMPDGYSVYMDDFSQKSIYMYNRISGDIKLNSPYRYTASGLTTGSTVYYRAYATNSMGTTYSSDSTVVAP